MDECSVQSARKYDWSSGVIDLYSLLTMHSQSHQSWRTPDAQQIETESLLCFCCPATLHLPIPGHVTGILLLLVNVRDRLDSGRLVLPAGNRIRVLVPAGISVLIQIFCKRPQSTDRGRRQHKRHLMSLCTYIRAWLIQVSGHFRHIHQHCHILSHCRWLRTRSSVDRRHMRSLCVLILEPD